MRNLIMNIGRYKALILAVVPCFIVGFCLHSLDVAEGFSGIGYLIILLAILPLLVVSSILSVIFAFNGKDPNRKLIRTTKVISILSMIGFVGVSVIGAIWMLVSAI